MPHLYSNIGIYGPCEMIHCKAMTIYDPIVLAKVGPCHRRIHPPRSKQAPVEEPRAKLGRGTCMQEKNVRPQRSRSNSPDKVSSSGCRHPTTQDLTYRASRDIRKQLASLPSLRRGQTLIRVHTTQRPHQAHRSGLRHLDHRLLSRR